jgi:uncharacterized membrane protein YcaP (DUF421 family)
MDSVVRALAIYVILLLIFRISGKRSLAQITTFDFVLLLIISEATQQAMLGNDFSMTNATIVILTLVGLDVGLSIVQHRFPTLGNWIDSVPLVLVSDGEVQQERLKKLRITEGDILSAAREKQGLERMEQVKYAVLERTGSISIVPWQQS